MSMIYNLYFEAARRLLPPTFRFPDFLVKFECESESGNKKSEALAPALTLTLFVTPSGLEQCPYCLI